MTNPAQTTNGPSDPSPAHIILVPFMAQGHMIPMVDLARLLATAGAAVTFITTAVNAARILPLIDRIEISHLPIRFVQLPFPAADAGLPPACENIDLIPSPHLFKTFMEALPLFGRQVERHLARATLPADCIVFDCLNSWVPAVARRLGVPHLLFYGPSCIYILCSRLLKKHRVLERMDDDHELFRVPELPEPVEVTKAQVARWMDQPGWEKLSREFYESEKGAFGAVMNTFEELEMSCLDVFRREFGKKVWPIGPLSLSGKEDAESAAMRGKASSIDTGALLKWLDSKKPRSVLLVSFGSLVRNPLSQMVEIGRGLESAAAAGFIWVVKEAEKSREVEDWVSEFEGRTKDRGLVIRGWAPQAAILNHAAVGGFMTHCGWNSTLEAVAAGVVMATWPRFGDQFVNERLVVDVLGVGVGVGAKVPVWFVDKMSEAAPAPAPVKGEEVRDAVEKVMGGGEEGEERRKRARELREKARKAMEEGGSSFQNVNGMIQFVRERRNNKHLELE